MQILTVLVVPRFENQRKQAITDPANSSVLFRLVHALIEIIRMFKDLLRFLEADASLSVRAKAVALTFIELKSHFSITVIP